MIRIKNKTEIIILKQGGKILAGIVARLAKEVKPGVSTIYLNELAEKLIKKAGGRSSFKGYKVSWAPTPYPSALCLSINQEVVHGLPVPDRILKDGDIIGIDCGLEFGGYYTDMAKTVAVGRVNAKVKKILTVTEESLMLGIKQVKPGNYISDISRAVQNHVVKNGFSVVEDLVGHGVGHAAHEEPQIPNYLDARALKIQLKAGMVLAIEPMVNMGAKEVTTLDDGWTVATADNSLSAHFEHTVLVIDDGYEILTK